MNVYRLMAMGVITGVAGLSVAACSAGITTAGPAASRSPATNGTAPSPTASPSHTASPPPSHTAAATVHVNAPIGSFPIPHGAQVAANISCPKQIIIMLSPVTPVQASTFYITALPRAGYRITDNFMSSDPKTGAPQGLVEIGFTGHGYTGTIITMADLGPEASAIPSAVTLPSSMTKNVAEITMSAPRTPESFICPT
jgi:hypothetical protein